MQYSCAASKNVAVDVDNDEIVVVAVVVVAAAAAVGRDNAEIRYDNLSSEFADFVSVFEIASFPDEYDHGTVAKFHACSDYLSTHEMLMAFEQNTKFHHSFGKLNIDPCR
jgi:hypothetical protein